MASSEENAVLAIPEQLAKIFHSTLSLPEEDLRKINAWARSNVSALIAGDFNPDSLTEELGVPAAAIYRASQMISSVLFLSEPPGIVDLDALATALREIGQEPENVSNAKVLLDGVRLDPSEAEFTRQKSYVSQVVLPTVDRVTAVCDLRSVFKKLPSPSTAKQHHKGVSTLLGFEPLAIVGIELSDASGNESTSSFQVNEKTLRTIIKTLEEALQQLETVRDHQKMIVWSSQ